MKKRSVRLLALITAIFSITTTAQGDDSAALNDEFVIAIHGGGGVRGRDDLPPEVEAEYRAALQTSLQAGYEILADGGDSVSAVEAAIRVMEDSPLFNAGKGSSFNAAGVNELDSSIMNGANLDAGAVAVIQKVKNPITAARRVMEASPHVLIAGDGALEFAREQGLDIVAPHYFFTERRWDSLQRRLEQGTEYGKSPKRNETAGNYVVPVVVDEANDPGLWGTVGAVALDRHGNIAAGTSTGGREGKHPGRVGDSPIIGAGTYAKNSTLAVSSTGLGEYVIRVGATKTMSDLIEYKGYSLDEATNAVLKIIEDMGGSIGVVAVDTKGNVSMPFSSNGMYRGYVRQDGNYVVHIYAE
jgi:beta-aspartyl-peptidase (threonine type)